jgi:hypothetical protein
MVVARRIGQCGHLDPLGACGGRQRVVSGSDYRIRHRRGGGQQDTISEAERRARAVVAAGAYLGGVTRDRFVDRNEQDALLHQWPCECIQTWSLDTIDRLQNVESLGEVDGGHRSAPATENRLYLTSCRRVSKESYQRERVEKQGHRRVRRASAMAPPRAPHDAAGSRASRPRAPTHPARP